MAILQVIGEFEGGVICIYVCYGHVYKCGMRENLERKCGGNYDKDEEMKDVKLVEGRYTYINIG